MRRRKYRKKQKKVIILSLSILMFLTVGYAAFSTNFSLKAKGNIIDTTNVEDLKKTVITDGDGLYVDEYETGRYVYRGLNPENYIQFNDELWQIISIESDNTLKIIRELSIGEMFWNSKKVDNKNWNDWNGSSLEIYLNGDFFSNIKESKHVILHNFSIGSVGLGKTLEEQINLEKSVVWQGRVGLLTVSEYIRANTNQELCGSLSLNNTNTNDCKLSNWLFKNDSYWTINKRETETNVVFFIYLDGGLSSYGNINTTTGVVYESTQNVRPIVYLNSDIALVGEGTKENPYVIIN